jgi:hypothetical protein
MFKAVAFGPLVQFVWLKPQPLVATLLSCPLLIMLTKVGYEQ